MDYTKIYEQLIEKAQLREMPDCYCEIHHIVPRCLYGSDDDRNLVALTAREHFIAHRLLAKMRPWHNGLLYAVASFMMGGKINGRQFELARKAITGILLSKEHREKLSIAKKGKKMPPFTKEHKEKLSEAGRRRAWSNEQKGKMSAQRKGKRKSKEHKEKLALAQRKRRAAEKEIVLSK